MTQHSRLQRHQGGAGLHRALGSAYIGGRTIKRGEIIGKRVGERPKDDAEHFLLCPACNGWIDCRDLGQVLEHAGPYRIPDRIRQIEARSQNISRQYVPLEHLSIARHASSYLGSVDATDEKAARRHRGIWH
jgi:hypothetical protein